MQTAHIQGKLKYVTVFLQVSFKHACTLEFKIIVKSYIRANGEIKSWRIKLYPAS